MNEPNPINAAILRDLFERAIDLPPQDRVPFLAAECANNIDLYNELIALLAADTAAANDKNWTRSAAASASISSGKKPD